VGCVRVFGQVGGRGREKQALQMRGGNLLPSPLRVQGKKMANIAIKMAPFAALSLLKKINCE